MRESWRMQCPLIVVFLMWLVCVVIFTLDYDTREDELKALHSCIVELPLNCSAAGDLSSVLALYSRVLAAGLTFAFRGLKLEVGQDLSLLGFTLAMTAMLVICHVFGNRNATPVLAAPIPNSQDANANQVPARRQAQPRRLR